MIRLGIVSDSHNLSIKRIGQAAQALQACSMDRLIHLGDGAGDADKLSELLQVPVISIAGNCDNSSHRPEEATLVLEGLKLLLCHGHRLRVKGTLLPLILRAQELGAQIALFGHTHLPYHEMESGILLLNPGSLANGRYAVLEIHQGAPSATLCQI